MYRSMYNNTKNGHGALYKCKKISEKSPKFTGHLKINGVMYSIGAWKREDGNFGLTARKFDEKYTQDDSPNYVPPEEQEQDYE